MGAVCSMRFAKRPDGSSPNRHDADRSQVPKTGNEASTMKRARELGALGMPVDERLGELQRRVFVEFRFITR